MFLFRSTYNKLVNQCAKLTAALEHETDKHLALRADWNSLVDKVNARGGQQFLDQAVIPTGPKQFTRDELKLLIKLAHPDKHGGNAAASDITAKLLGMLNAT